MAGNDTIDHAALLEALRAGGLRQAAAPGTDFVWTNEDANGAMGPSGGEHDATIAMSDGDTMPAGLDLYVPAQIVSHHAEWLG